MLLQYFYDERLAQASYLVGCPASASAIVIDPSRNIAPYIEAAARRGLNIEFVTETHIHADFVSGTRELAAATGALMLLSDEGGSDWAYQFSDENIRFLRHHDSFHVGGVKFDVLHTPGHTPEHISFMVTDVGQSDPIGIFTGDFLFVGDVGRPDLLEEAAGIADTRDPGARQQFANLQSLRNLPDYLQIWPGHGAGSACGKALGAIPSTTLGYEKRFNPAFQFSDEDAFVAWLLEGQPEVPRYFGRMKFVNKVGPALLRELPQAQHIQEKPDADLIPQDALLIDTRPGEDFAKRHLPGSVNIPISVSSFPTYLGWYVDYNRPLFFIAYRNDVLAVLNALFSIGVDHVPGYFTAEVTSAVMHATNQKTPQEIYEMGVPIIDVRSSSEYQSQHIPGVTHIHMGRVLDRLADIPQHEMVAVQCGSGERSQVVVSLLEKNGYHNIINMQGGINAWKDASLPLVEN
jgi:hydroxyacylglutathione hydrolase